jgi:hypothetical protein
VLIVTDEWCYRQPIVLYCCQQKGESELMKKRSGGRGGCLRYGVLCIHMGVLAVRRGQCLGRQYETAISFRREAEQVAEKEGKVG